MLMLMSLALLPTEKDHFRAKNNNLRNLLLAYWHPKSVDFLKSRLILKQGLKVICFIVVILNSFALFFVFLFRSENPSCNSELVLSACMLYKHNKTYSF